MSGRPALDPKTALRELILGAVDRIERSSPGEAVREEIRLLPDTAEGTLSIVDGAAGLSPAEVEDGLGEASAGTEGFWAGWLACQSFCSRQEILTRGSRILCNGDGTIEIGRAEVATPGTAVHLRLLPEHSNLLDDALLTRLIKKSCDFVRFPIYLGRGLHPVNHPDAPWYREGPQPDLLRALQTLFQIGTLLAVFPLQIAAAGTGPRVCGALYVRPRRHRPTLRLYCRGVFVAATDASLLGSGLRDVMSGVIDVDMPTRAAGRELLEPASLQGAWLRQVLVQTAANGLLGLARQRKKHFQELMQEHGPAVKAACLADPEELGELRHHFPYRTSLREAATVPEILAGRQGRVVIYADDLGVAAPLIPLYNRSNTEVVYMMHPVDEKLRAGWMQDGARIELQRFDFDPPGDLSSLPMDDEDRLLTDLITLFRSAIDPALSVMLTSLGADGPPAVLSISEPARARLEMLLAIRSRQEQDRNNELPPELIGVEASVDQTLLLNRSHKIVGHLLAGLAAENAEPLIALCLYSHALLSSGLHLPRSKVAELARTMTELITNLLTQTD
jgi:HSP90 family molecular chaperone